MTDTRYDVAHQPLFGLEIAALRMPEAVALADGAITDRVRFLVGAVNAAKVVKLHHNVFLRDSLLECDVLLADGQAVVWGAQLLGHPLPERVAGIDLFQALLELADRDKRRVYLLGARQDVLDKLTEEIARRWPRAVVVGSRNGYFTEEESDEVAAAITESRADMLFLGMTTPKKEIFLGSYADTMGVPVLHGVGGSFDVLAGVTRRAPLRWQRLGMEWAYRLLQEPRRLWRRYLVTNTLFAWMLLRERIRPRPLYEPAQPILATGRSVPAQRSASPLREFPKQRSSPPEQPRPSHQLQSVEPSTQGEEVAHE